MLGGLIIAAGDTEGQPGVAWRTRRAAKDARREARHLAARAPAARPALARATGHLRLRPWRRPRPWPAPRATGPVDAVVSLPGSKSLTNRALVLAALADGPSRRTPRAALARHRC